ncbi:MAG: DUF6273 domain-containing protein, partial [Bacteroidales bacterium]|nr:DUF6273 domain-containing protein [Bacteroidales bacterium]
MMKTFSKRFLTMLLAVAMVFSLSGMTTFAAETDDADAQQAAEADALSEADESVQEETEPEAVAEEVAEPEVTEDVAEGDAGAEADAEVMTLSSEDENYETQELATWSSDCVCYAVKIWGIGVDEDENGNKLGLTFGPALGTDYTSSTKESCGSTYCIHNMTWEEIIAQNAKDPTVFETCMENGCTATVELTPNEKLFNQTAVNAAAQYFTGDGVTTLDFLLDGDGSTSYDRGAVWNASSSYSATSNLYSESRIRTTLNGNENGEAGTYAGSDLCDSENCLLSCFPKELQDAIVPRATVNAGSPAWTTSANDKTTYDKLWLFTPTEVGYEFSSSNSGYYDGGGTDYGIAKSARDRYAYEFGTTSLNSSGQRGWWTRARHGDEVNVAYYMSSGDASSNNSVTSAEGLSPCFCLPAASSSGETNPDPDTGDPDESTGINYAVKIWGINADKYSTDNGETTETAALTFGPALGADYTESYVSRETVIAEDGSHESESCIHDMTWSEIISQCETDPSVFSDCLANGCTKAVALTPNTTLFNDTTVDNVKAKGFTGDGVSTLHYLLNGTGNRISSWNHGANWNYYNEDCSTDDPANVYSKSRIRVTLNGDSSDAEMKYASSNNGEDLCNGETCLLSCFPSALQSAIVPRETVNTGNATTGTSANDKTTYDKLFLFSLAEAGIANADDDSGGTDYKIYDSEENKPIAYEFTDTNATTGTSQWWTRSRTVTNGTTATASTSTYAAFDVSVAGAASNNYIYYYGGLSPAFCIAGATSTEPEVEQPTVSDVKITAEGLDEDNTKTEDGSGVTLTASATVAPEGVETTYQWYKDDEELSGETSATLTLAGEVSDTGTYKCVVTATNSAGDASNSAEITITIKEAESATVVKYAVKIWGIETDKDEEGNTLALTFGPALGVNYMINNKASCGSEYCIHNMSWADIISQCETDPTVFETCKTNGCTKTVEITPNKKLFNDTAVEALQSYTGDGVTTLDFVLTGDGTTSYTRGAIWDLSSSWDSSDPSNLYSESRLRVTLTGDQTYVNKTWAGSDLCDTTDCLLSCFPKELQDAIEPRETVNAGVSGSAGSTANDRTTYDMLWLPSLVEVGIDVSSQYYDGGGTDYEIATTDGQRIAYELGNTSFSTYGSRNWYSRSRQSSQAGYSFFIGSSGSASSTTNTNVEGISPCFCIGVIESTEEQPTASNITISSGLTDNIKTYDGEGVTLTVSADVSPDTATVSYQWYKGDEKIDTLSLMPDASMATRLYALDVQPLAATESTCTLAGNVSDSGTYKCELTVTNDDESATFDSDVIEVTINPATQIIDFADGEEVTKATSDGTYTNAITEDSVVFGEVTYDSSNEDVATVDENGEVTILAAGETTITATAAGDEENSPANYAAASASYTLTVTDDTSASDDTINYAVKIYGIQKDTYKDDDGNTGTAALTFGPATGTDYTGTYEECESEYCIHKLTWTEIINQCAKDPTVFNSCLTNGCTKAVELTPNDTLFNQTTVTNALAQNYSGDGVSVLYNLLNSSYVTWNNSTSSNLYSKSRIRATLNGADSYTDASVAGNDTLSTGNCLFSCFPSELQSAIVPRETVNSASNSDETTYDKLFLLSRREAGDTSTASYDDGGGESYGVNSAGSDLIGYEFASTSASSSEKAYWWTRSRSSSGNTQAFTIDDTGYGRSYNVNNDWSGISPAFCIGGTSSSEPTTETADVKYAVSIWGINQDVDENGNPLVTFGPATGANYVSGSQSCNSGYCIHNMEWSDIIEQCADDPTVFQSCLANGCTTSVDLALNETLANDDYTSIEMTGDGVGMLYDSINSDYRKWNNVSTAQTGTTGGWPASRIRATLNGADTLTNETYAGTDTLTTGNCLFSCFPEELQDAIVAKTVHTGTVWSTQTEENSATTYDKLWLFSGAEVYGEGSSNSIIHLYEGTLYARSTQFGITTSNYGKLANYEEAGSASHRWWLRTIPTSGGSIANNVMVSGDWSSTTVTDGTTCGIAFGFCVAGAEASEPEVTGVTVTATGLDEDNAKTYNGAGVNLTAAVEPEDADVTYQWYKVDGDNETLLDGNGSTFITGSNVSDSGTYKCVATASDGSSASGTIEITINKATQSIEFTDGTEVAKTTDDETYTNEITEDSVVYGALSYTSSEEDVASVDNDGLVTIKAAGTTEITATAAASDEGNYDAVSASYTLTVTEATGPTVKYAVKIWGIEKDKYKDEDGSGVAALTFGPAFGANYTNSYVSKETVVENSGTHNSTYCIHDMTWA